MALIIAGHQRSGTSMLQLLCNHHPQIGMTMELASFMKVGVPFNEYSRFIRWRWAGVRNRPGPLIPPRQKSAWRTKLANNRFMAEFVWHLYRHRQPIVDTEMIGAILSKFFPQANVVGDKYPDYIYQLNKLTEQAGLQRLVIYRDVRDVVSSTLKKVRTDWKGMDFASKMYTAEKVSVRLLDAIELMDQYQEHIYCLRYEDLVTEPVRELTQLGKWLDVRPDGFPFNWVKPTSIGKYQTHLTESELSAVLDVAGPVMKDMGYVY